MGWLIAIVLFVIGRWIVRFCWHHSRGWEACQQAWHAVAMFRREADACREYPIRVERELLAEAKTYVSAHRSAARQAFQLDELREFGAKNIRWGSLSDAGVRSLDDLVGASVARLTTLPGVGDATAMRVTAAAQAALADLERRPIPLPGQDLDPPRSVEFVAAAARAREATAALGQLPQKLDDISRELASRDGDLRRNATILRWLLSDKEPNEIVTRARDLLERAQAALESDHLLRAKRQIEGIEGRWRPDADPHAMVGRARSIYPALVEDLRTALAAVTPAVVAGPPPAAAQPPRVVPPPPPPVARVAEAPVPYVVTPSGGYRPAPTPAPRDTTDSANRSVATTRRSARWVPASETVEVQGYRIPGGLLYVADEGSPSAQAGDDPALIDPALPVRRNHPDLAGSAMAYWPWYSRISAECRAAYLEWLAGGRRDPNAYIGYVFLFFYGLERRLLADARRDRRAEVDTAAIVAEVERLLAIYGTNDSFRGYARGFLGVARARELATARLCDGAPPPLDRGMEIPLAVKVGLGQFVAQGRPIAPEWAFSWAAHDPGVFLRTPATRCPEEFRELFLQRFKARFGDGLKLAANRTPLVVRYQPSSAAFSGPVAVHVGELQDVTVLAVPLRKLRALMQECTDALDAYSRWVGRHGADRDSPQAIATLPPELAVRAGGQRAQALCAWVEGALGGSEIGSGLASELIERWHTGAKDRLARADAISLAQFLERHGFGIEPDVRFGGEVIESDGRVVVFRQASAPASTPSAAYVSAAMLLRLGVAVAGTDGSLADTERAFLEAKADGALDLLQSERMRLRAHLRWLLDSNVGLGGLKKKVEALTPESRARLGEFAVGVAAADGKIEPAEVKTLLRVFELLALDPDDVYTQLHRLGGAAAKAQSLAGPPAERDVRNARSATPDAPPQVPVGAIALDPEKVKAKLAEAEAVRGVLEYIFTEASPAPAPAPVPVASVPGIWSLDSAHSALLRDLLARDSWAREEYASLAQRHRLMPEGALETINDAAFEAVGEPILEGEDPLEIRAALVEERVS